MRFRPRVLRPNRWRPGRLGVSVEFALQTPLMAQTASWRTYHIIVGVRVARVERQVTYLKAIVDFKHLNGFRPRTAMVRLASWHPLNHFPPFLEVVGLSNDLEFLSVAAGASAGGFLTGTFPHDTSGARGTSGSYNALKVPMRFVGTRPFPECIHLFHVVAQVSPDAADDIRRFTLRLDARAYPMDTDFEILPEGRARRDHPSFDLDLKVRGPR